MNRNAAIFAGFLISGCAASNPALAQKSLKDQLVGAWRLESIYVERDGQRSQPWGSDPVGLFIFDPSGYYTAHVTKPGRLKFASNNRETGTDAENKAAVQGTLTTFGIYTIDEADRSVTVKIVASSYPNWDGAEQKRIAEIKGDELIWKLPVSSTGQGTAVTVLKRAK